MQQFVLHLDEEMQSLVDICKMLGKHNIDIVSMAGTSAFGICTAILFTDDEESTRQILRQMDIPFSTQDVLVASLPDEPGSFGHFAQLLFDQGIRILSFYVLRFTSNHADYAFSVSEVDFEKAKSFLDASGFLKSSNTKKKVN
ncbi:MAG: hypothetical protein ACTSW1_10070 [Candidatus Hodarchaeales archaeon]